MNTKLAFLSCLAAVSTAVSHAQVSYIRKGQSVPLSEVPGKILVTPNSGATSNTVASSSGVSPASVKSLTSRTFAIQATVSSRTLVDAAALQAGNAFAAPVFTKAGKEFSPTQRINVTYAPGINPTLGFATVKQLVPEAISQKVAGKSVGIVTVGVKNGYLVIDAANRLARSGGAIRAAAPDFIFEKVAKFVPPDPLFAQSWHQKNNGNLRYGDLSGFDIRMPEAWDLSLGSPSVRVVVIDEGVENRPGLRVLASANFSGGPGNGEPSPTEAHGTACAGLIAEAHDGSGSAGIAPLVSLYNAKVLEEGYGALSALMEGLLWADQLDAHVASISLGWPADMADEATEEVMAYVRSRGLVLIAAAGNEFEEGLLFPALSASCIPVAATSSYGGKAYFSSYGNHPNLVSAPGEFICTSDLTGDAGYGPGNYIEDFGGTSAATPIVAGIVCQLLAREPWLTPGQVTQRIISTARDLGKPGFDNIHGHGHIDAFRCLNPNAPALPPLLDEPDTAPGIVAQFDTNQVVKLGWLNDADVLSVTMTRAGTLTCQSGGEVDPVGELLNDLGQVLFSQDDVAPGNYNFLFSVNVPAGRYHLKVKADYYESIGSVTVLFRATVPTAPRMEMVGPNGGGIADGASATSGNGTAFDAVTSAGGTTRRIFTIRNTGDATLTLNNGTLSGGPFRLLSQPALQISAGRASSFTAEFAPTVSGSFGSTVTFTSNDSATSPYTFGISGNATIPIADDHGDTRSTATPVYRISNTTARMERQMDSDYLRFDMPAGTRTVVCETLGGIDTKLHLYNSAGSQVGGSSSGGQSGYNAKFTTSLAGGTYYLKLSGEWSTTTGGPITISIH